MIPLIASTLAVVCFTLFAVVRGLRKRGPKCPSRVDQLAWHAARATGPYLPSHKAARR